MNIRVLIPLAVASLWFLPLRATPAAPPAPPEVSVAVEARADEVAASAIRPMIGVVAVPVDRGLAAHLRLSPGTGLVIETISPRSGAADAGLQRYDILLKFEDQILVNNSQMGALVGTRQVGDVVNLTLLRAGETLVVPVTLKARPRGMRMSHPAPPAPPTAPRPPGAAPTASRQIIITRPDGDDIVVNVPQVQGLADLGDRISAALEQALGDNPDGVSLSERIATTLAQSGVEFDSAALRERLAQLQERLRDLDQTRLAIDVQRIAEDTAENVRRVSTLRVSKARKSYRGDEGSAELVEVEGSRQLTVRDPAGEVVFEGPVDTPEQREALPPLAKDLHAKLSDPAKYEFRWEAQGPRPD